MVTRYFGGTLLGTGGLVRAYTAAAIGALEGAEVIRYDIYSEIEFAVSYSDYGKITGTLSELGFRSDDTDFGADIKMKGRILKSELPNFEKQLTDLTSARSKITLLGEKFDF